MAMCADTACASGETATSATTPHTTQSAIAAAAAPDSPNDKVSPSALPTGTTSGAAWSTRPARQFVPLSRRVHQPLQHPHRTVLVPVPAPNVAAWKLVHAVPPCVDGGPVAPRPLRCGGGAASEDAHRTGADSPSCRGRFTAEWTAAMQQRREGKAIGDACASPLIPHEQMQAGQDPASVTVQAALAPPVEGMDGADVQVGGAGGAGSGTAGSVSAPPPSANARPSAQEATAAPPGALPSEPSDHAGFQTVAGRGCGTAVFVSDGRGGNGSIVAAGVAHLEPANVASAARPNHAAASTRRLNHAGAAAVEPPPPKLTAPSGAPAATVTVGGGEQEACPQAPGAAAAMHVQSAPTRVPHPPPPQQPATQVPSPREGPVEAPHAAPRLLHRPAPAWAPPGYVPAPVNALARDAALVARVAGVEPPLPGLAHLPPHDAAALAASFRDAAAAGRPHAHIRSVLLPGAAPGARPAPAALAPAAAALGWGGVTAGPPGCAPPSSQLGSAPQQQQQQQQWQRRSLAVAHPVAQKGMAAPAAAHSYPYPRHGAPQPPLFPPPGPSLVSRWCGCLGSEGHVLAASDERGRAVPYKRFVHPALPYRR